MTFGSANATATVTTDVEFTKATFSASFTIASSVGNFVLRSSTSGNTIVLQSNRITSNVQIHEQLLIESLGPTSGSHGTLLTINNNRNVADITVQRINNDIALAAGVYLLKITGISSNAETRRTLTVTVLAALTQRDSWHQTHFNTTSNTGNAADSADPDFDGISNLLEFATGTLPKVSNIPPGSLVKSGATLDFSYRRSHAAVADGFTFAVEWSDTLGIDWSVHHVIQQVVPSTDDGTAELWQATMPAGEANKRFVRMKSEKP